MGAKPEPDLNDVGLLVRVVQLHSFSAAARERGVPVSSVSRRISRLESALGTRLLERTTRSLRLTDAGRVYFDHAARAMEELVHGTGQLAERHAEPRGRVRVLAPTWLAGAVGRVVHGYLERHPKVSVDLDLTHRVLPRAAEGFDIAIVAGGVGDTGDFVVRPIWSADPKRLFASPAGLKARGAPRSVGELSKHALIATRAQDGFATWALVRGREKRRLTFAPRFSVSEISAARDAALAGVGIALLPQLLCTEDLARKRLLHVLEGWEGEGGGVDLLHRAGRSLPIAVRACIDRLLTELPPLDPRRMLR